MAVFIQGLELFAVSPKQDCPHIIEMKESNPQLENCADNVKHEAFSGACSACQSKVENWVCLTCGNLYCSRYVAGHAADHNEKEGHGIAISLSDLSVWCYKCDSYIESQPTSKIVRSLSDIKFGHPKSKKEE